MTAPTIQTDARRLQRADRIDHRMNQRDERQRAKAASALALWNSSPAPGVHPWLESQSIAAHGLRQRDNRLLVPMRDAAGELWNLLFIGPSGGLRMLYGARVFGLFHLIDRHDAGKTYNATLGELLATWEPPAVVNIAEDYASAARVHAATGQPVAVAFELHNLRPVALALRSEYRRARIVVWLPEPHQSARSASGNHRGAVTHAEGAAAAVGGSVAVLWGRS